MILVYCIVVCVCNAGFTLGRQNSNILFSDKPETKLTQLFRGIIQTDDIGVRSRATFVYLM